MGKIKEAYAARNYLRGTMKTWHPLGRPAGFFAVIPSMVALGLSLSYLNFSAALLICIPLWVALEFMLGFWALRKIREVTEPANDQVPA